MMIKVDYKRITDKPFRYQWLRNGEPIQGANKFHYVPTTDDVGQKLERVADYMVDIYKDEANEQD